MDVHILFLYCECIISILNILYLLTPYFMYLFNVMYIKIYNFSSIFRAFEPSLGFILGAYFLIIIKYKFNPY